MSESVCVCVCVCVCVSFQHIAHRGEFRTDKGSLTFHSR